MPYAQVNGTRLYYEVTGAGDPIVLIHGLGVDIRIWEHQVAPLARAHTVIRYDTRGHGRSALPAQEPYSHAAILHNPAAQAHLAAILTGYSGFHFANPSISWLRFRVIFTCRNQKTITKNSE